MINLAVLFGGPSVEHEVSVITAQQALHVLGDFEDYHLVPVYIDKKGRWYTGDALLSLESFKDLKALEKNITRVNILKTDKGAALHRWPLPKVGDGKIADIDVAFPIIHGSFGEDGALQGLLEYLDIPYTGSNVLGAAMTMDKIASKFFLKDRGIPVIEGTFVYSSEWLDDEGAALRRIEETLDYPVIVKPADIGSSVGIQIAHHRQGLIDALDQAIRFSERILIERKAENFREINVSLVGSKDGIECSLLEEPFFSEDILSFSDKYEKGEKGGEGMASLKRKIPADLTEEQADEVHRIAKEAYRLLDLSGIVRIDFILESDRIYMNEFNTTPGSLSFYLWEPAGVPFDELLKKHLAIGYANYRRKKALVHSHDTNILATADLSGGKK